MNINKFLKLVARKWFIVVFLIFITIPFLQMNFNFIKSESILNEKRELAKKPIFDSTAPLTDYFSSYENYFKDNFGFRENLIRLNNKVELDLFKNSPNENVILGKDDYLFTSEEMDDYNKINLLTDEEIEKIAINIKKFQEDLKERGKSFLFTIAPNKSTIYPEYMTTSPSNPNELSNLDKLKLALEKHDVNYLDLKDFLISKKEEYPLYYKRDTHWNSIAASLVANEIINYFATDFNINGSIIPTDITTKKRLGDLDEMLGIDSNIKEFSCTPEIIGNEVKIPKIISYFDSFGMELMPILDNFFQQRIGFHNLRDPIYSNYPQFEANSNIVFFEMVERYIPKLVDYDFNIYDDKFIEDSNLDEFKLPLDPLDNSLNLNNFIPYKNDLGFTYGSIDKSNSLTWNFHSLTGEFLNIATTNNSQYTQLKIYFANENEDFSEENSISIMLTPIKNNYLIPIDKFGEISKIKISSPLKKTVDLNFENISIIKK